MMKIAIDVKPDAVSLVPKSQRNNHRRRLECAHKYRHRARRCESPARDGCPGEPLHYPDPFQIEAAREVNAQQVELWHRAYAEADAGASEFTAKSRASKSGTETFARKARHWRRNTGYTWRSGHGLTVET